MPDGYKLSGLPAATGFAVDQLLLVSTPDGATYDSEALTGQLLRDYLDTVYATTAALGAYLPLAGGILTGTLTARQVDVGVGYGLTVDTTALIVTPTTKTVTMAGSLAVATNVLVANLASYTGKVGVNTATPASALDVVGTISVDGVATVDRYGTSGLLIGAYSSTLPSGNYTVAVGDDAGTLSTGANCFFAAHQAGYLASGSYISALGNLAGRTYSGNYGTFFGVRAGYMGSAGGAGFMSAYGAFAGYNRTGSASIYFGYQAGLAGAILGGGEQIGIGTRALQSNSGAGTISIGYESGLQTPVVGGGANSCHFGYQAGYTNTAANQLNLGYKAGYGVTTASRMYIGYDAPVTNSAILYGELPNTLLQVNASTINLRYTNAAAAAQKTVVNIANSVATSEVGFFGVTAVVRATALTAGLTTVTHTAPGTPDYAVQDLIDSSAGAAFGFATKDEGNTVLSVVANLQTRVGELETKLQAYGLLN